MESLSEQIVSCPYCGEQLSVLIDPQEAGHQYTEDCQVCCQPIVFSVQMDSSSELHVTVQSEDESY